MPDAEGLHFSAGVAMVFTPATAMTMATFDRSTPFEHFQNQEHPECFACNSRKMHTRPLLVSKDYILMEATTQEGNGIWYIMPGTWLVFPREHITNPRGLPPNWVSTTFEAADRLRLTDFHANMNIGHKAGQTVSHLHTWLIDRSRSRRGSITENTGPATVFLRLEQQGL